jgi:toxin ParE1/3/4
MGSRAKSPGEVRRLDFTATARRDIATALSNSYRQFGQAALSRYRGLLNQAYDDLRTDPERAEVTVWRESDLHLYHLRQARARTSDRVRAPRHFIVFKSDATRVLIVRLLYDSMDIDAHLEDES